jgi:hypothetical protein
MTKTEDLTVSESNRTTATATDSTLRPVDNNSDNRGLYVVTTYDAFFKEEVNGNNGNGNGTEKSLEVGSHG